MLGDSQAVSNAESWPFKWLHAYMSEEESDRGGRLACWGILRLQGLQIQGHTRMCCRKYGVKRSGQCWVAKFMSPGSCIILTAGFFCSCGELHTPCLGMFLCSPVALLSEIVVVVVACSKLYMLLAVTPGQRSRCHKDMHKVAVSYSCLYHKTCARACVWHVTLVCWLTCMLHHSSCLHLPSRMNIQYQDYCWQHGIEWTKLNS
jgi:hypothetical protein